ncbi:MAG TPA: MFS transporter [Pseudonocardiaceae bacterium]|nr:MFS transporter [Pseudonocardiaceae bacterium]
MPAAAMFCMGWGGNQFTPLLIVYRDRAGYSEVGVDVFLGAYVVGLIPGLLIASALSDRFGRKPVLLAGLVASIIGSAVLAAGQVGGAGWIIAGRLLCGVGVGIAMAVGTAWVSELSTPDFDPAAGSGAGARRASIALTLGLGIGPGCAGLLAQWAPLPLVLPYVVQVALAIPALVLLWSQGVETRFDRGAVGLWRRLRVPAAGHGRFRWVVLPMAPWIFGSAGVAYAIVPQLVDARVGRWALLFTTVLTVATLGTGVAVQPIAKRLDDRSTARAVFWSMVLMSCGIVAAAVTAGTRSPWLAAPVALLLGAAYGIAVVSGLLEIQRIAAPDELAGLTGVYYALAYVGFLLPATLAALATWLPYPVMLAVLAFVAIGCTGTIRTAWSRHLPGVSAVDTRTT